MAAAARGSGAARWWKRTPTTQRHGSGRSSIGRRRVMVLGARSRKETANRRRCLERRPSRDSGPQGRIVRPTALQVLQSVSVTRYYDILCVCVCVFVLCLCVCVCVCTYIIHTPTPTHTHTHTCIHILYIYTHRQTHTQTHTHTHTHNTNIHLPHTPLLTHLLSRSSSHSSQSLELEPRLSSTMIYYDIL
jgi:hypothetical protein